MGCGASGGKPAAEDPNAVSETEVTWAQPVKGLGAEPAKASALAGTAISSHAHDLQMQDAEDDEIEIIHEARPQRHDHGHDCQRHAAANAQEPPDAVEDLTQEHKPVPLSKQQLEEAQKAAEIRSRFDNQKYLQTQSVTTRPPPAAARKPPACTPASDMVMGLNHSKGKTSSNLPAEFEELPGGVYFDEAPAGRAGPTKSSAKHDDIQVTGLLDDDEDLMQSILDSVET